MIYSLSTGSSYLHHLQTQSRIKETGQRIERAMHSGMMSLATSQAKAMKELGTRIDDRLVEIDESILRQDAKLDLIQDSLRQMNTALAQSFENIDRRFDDINRKLDKVADDVANPEKARAYERFRRALAFFHKGDYARALDAVDRAIANDDGPDFSEVTEFHILKARLHMGSTHNTHPDVVDPEKAFSAFWEAARSAKNRSLQSECLLSAGLAIYAAGNPTKAQHFMTMSTEIQPNAPAHFHAARAALQSDQPALARKHLLSALEMDWNYIIASATDPDCIAHADIIEPLIKKFTQDRKAELMPGLTALAHVVGGTSYNNILTARKILQNCGNDLSPGIATLDQPERLLTEEEKSKMIGLKDPNIGLLDITNTLRQINGRRDDLGYDAIDLSLSMIFGSWQKTLAALDEIEQEAAKGDVHYHVGLPSTCKWHVPHPLPSTGIKKVIGLRSAEQKKRDSEIAHAKAQNEALKSVRASNAKIMKEVFMPALVKVHQRCIKEIEIHKTATQTFIKIVGEENTSRKVLSLH